MTASAEAVAARIHRRAMQVVQKVVEDRGKWQRIARAVLDLWLEELGKLSVPSRFKAAYARCLRIDTVDKRRVRVVFDTARVSAVDQMFAQAVEYGVKAGGIDMKPWLLAGKPFRDIPIEQKQRSIAKMTPTKAGGSIEQTLKRLRGLRERSTDAAVRTTAAGRGSTHPEGMVDRLRPGKHLTAPEYWQQKKMVADGARKAPSRYAHATDPLDRAFRQAGPAPSGASAKTARMYGRKGSVFVIRRISEKSDPRSWHWMRRGMRGAHLARKIRKQAREIARLILLGPS